MIRSDFHPDCSSHLSTLPDLIRRKTVYHISLFEKPHLIATFVHFIITADILKHLEKIQAKISVNIKKLALDAGYDVGAVHRGLEVLGITGYVSCIDFSYDILETSNTYQN